MTILCQYFANKYLLNSLACLCYATDSVKTIQMTSQYLSCHSTVYVLCIERILTFVILLSTSFFVILLLCLYSHNYESYNFQKNNQFFGLRYTFQQWSKFNSYTQLTHMYSPRALKNALNSLASYRNIYFVQYHQSYYKTRWD